MKTTTLITAAFIVAFILVLTSSCREDEVFSEIDKLQHQDNLDNSELSSPEIFSEVIQLDSIPTEEIHEMADETTSNARTTNNYRLSANKDYEVFAYLKAHRLQDSRWWSPRSKDEIYIKSVEVTVNNGNRTRRGDRDYNYFGKEWGFRNGQSRTIGPLFRSSRYLSGGIDTRDYVGLTYTIVDEKDQWKSAILKWAGAVALKVANVFTKGALTPLVKDVVNRLLKDGVKNMYESIFYNGDDIIGTVYVNIEKYGSNSLILKGESIQFARKTGQGRGWVQYKLNGNGADYTLRLYVKEQKVATRPRNPVTPNPPPPPCKNCHVF